MTRAAASRWNRLRWSLIAPLYDRVRFFTRLRARSIVTLEKT